MICKKCNSANTRTIVKSSGEKITNCKNCGYNFSQNNIKQTQTLKLSNLLNLIGFLRSTLVLFLILVISFSFLAGLDYFVVNNRYGLVIAIMFGFLLLLVVPILYVIIVFDLYQNKEGIFAYKLNFWKRFSFLLLTFLLGFISFCIVFLNIFFISNFAKDIYFGSKEECMVFVKILDEKASRGSKGGRIYKNYVEFKTQNGETKKLADLKLDYKKIENGTQICFDYFENLNIYSNDKIKKL
jgi:hypothetical protein